MTPTRLRSVRRPVENALVAVLVVAAAVGSGTLVCLGLDGGPVIRCNVSCGDADLFYGCGGGGRSGSCSGGRAERIAQPVATEPAAPEPDAAPIVVRLPEGAPQ